VQISWPLRLINQGTGGQARTPRGLKISRRNRIVRSGAAAARRSTVPMLHWRLVAGVPSTRVLCHAYYDCACGITLSIPSRRFYVDGDGRCPDSRERGQASHGDLDTRRTTALIKRTLHAIRWHPTSGTWSRVHARIDRRVRSDDQNCIFFRTQQEVHASKGEANER
jgi:hypothetical protein